MFDRSVTYCIWSTNEQESLTKKYVRNKDIIERYDDLGSNAHEKNKYRCILYGMCVPPTMFNALTSFLMGSNDIGLRNLRRKNGPRSELKCELSVFGL